MNTNIFKAVIILVFLTGLSHAGDKWKVTSIAVPEFGMAFSQDDFKVKVKLQNVSEVTSVGDNTAITVKLISNGKVIEKTSVVFPRDCMKGAWVEFSIGDFSVSDIKLPGKDKHSFSIAAKSFVSGGNSSALTKKYTVNWNK